MNKQHNLFIPVPIDKVLVLTVTVAVVSNAHFAICFVS
jgi:hypothetical protein